MSYLQIRKITKIYNENKTNAFTALKGITLDIEKGECIAIQGESGSGKSTLLHIMGCLDYPTKGEYYINGKQILFTNTAITSKLRNKHIGFVLQDFGLLLNESVIENVKVPLLFSNIAFGQMNKQCLNALHMLGIEKLSNKKANQLSGGQKQRVAIARALVNNPQVILADEPTGSLDSKTSQEVLNVLLDLNKSGRIVVIVTHDNNVARQCDRIIKINDGLLLS